MGKAQKPGRKHFGLLSSGGTSGSAGRPDRPRVLGRNYEGPMEMDHLRAQRGGHHDRHHQPLARHTASRRPAASRPSFEELKHRSRKFKVMVAGRLSRAGRLLATPGERSLGNQINRGHQAPNEGAEGEGRSRIQRPERLGSESGTNSGGTIPAAKG